MSKKSCGLRVEMQVQPFRVNRDGKRGRDGFQASRKTCCGYHWNQWEACNSLSFLVVASAAHLMTLQLSRATPCIFVQLKMRAHAFFHLINVLYINIVIIII